ncbi:PepSY-associated TM helix domain-containing protein [Maribacter polysaccharolyticus]|uniref:PepSY-associated TM helix domain-containing protein n=1 Tax=Maribacter polysaccharolyticus TaxID=3020831 RepID=UPI00237FCD72|nr:PepSY-associated TM helix domain-containing protein [Maribacter polysaccharolyticus]MDE3743279.1 PepSY-associated TM helix domain-containing protein [Maribacter polysaccharolyticus]
MKKFTFRKLINDLHLWLGIGSGIVLFVVCLTGTILAFETELVSFFDREDHYSEKQGERVPFDRLIHTLQGNDTLVKEFIFYGAENRNHRFTLLTKEQIENSNGKPVRGTTVSIDPYSGQRVQATGKTKAFMHTVEQLHRYLLLDRKIGRPIVGVCTIIFVFMCLSGLILWFPKKLKKFRNWKAWKQGFTIKTKASWKRVNYDFHNTFGFYALLPLLLMGLTGLLWSFTWYYDGLEKVLGDQLGKSRFEKTISIASENTPRERAVLDFDTLLHKTDSILPYANFATRVTLPMANDQSIMIRKIGSGFLAYNAADKLHFNPHTNALVSATYFKDGSVGSKIAGLIRGIHVGDFAGMATKIIYFICCLIATTLPITGTLIWINKMKKKR